MSPARLIRSAGFRLALAHAAIFAVAVASLFAVVYWMTSSYAHRQLVDSISFESYELTSQARREGLSAVGNTITARLLASGEPNLAYLLVDSSGARLAGNLDVPRATGGWQELQRPANGSLGPPDEDDAILTLGTVLEGGGVLLVGADTNAREELLEWIIDAFVAAGTIAVALALAGGLALGLSLTRRVESIHRAAARIIDGDLGQRIALRNTDDEFDRLSRQLNRMLDRIQGLMEGVRQVSSDIAHDLRTPLTRLRQHLDSARARASSLAQYEMAVDRAIEETDLLLATFGALLRIAQIEAGARREGVATADLSEIFERIREAYAAVAEDQCRPLTASIASGVLVEGDRELLTQLLANLVENALAHTPPGTPIELLLLEDRGRRRAVVADRGPGIPEAARARVFERFARLDGSRSTPGSGLGLSLVSAVAELHGIRVQLEDNQPGLRVVLDLPPFRRDLGARAG